jgi:hypothetical protein
MPTKLENPFSTCFTKPGQIPFIESESNQLDEIVDRFINAEYVGQIVGPHGSGKTTLTFDIQRRIATQSGHGIHFLRKTVGENGKVLDTARRNTPADGSCSTLPNGNQSTRILVLDGFERLPWYARTSLVHRCRVESTGLLITSHQRIRGLPVVASRLPKPKDLLSIVHHLIRDDAQANLIFSPQRLEFIFEDNAGNLRECLMACYDEYEANCCNT